MASNFTLKEGSQLYDLLSHSTQDIFFKTDGDGFILHCSPGMIRVGVDPGAMLIGPHLTDLVEPRHEKEVRRSLALALGGITPDQPVEFRLRDQFGERLWYSLKLTPAFDRTGWVYGALGVLRCITDRRELEDRLFVKSMTDPLTGLANRGAFVSMLQHLVQRQSGGSMAMLAIDHFKSINIIHGQRAGDIVLAAVAKFLRKVLRQDDILARSGGGTFVVLMPHDMEERAKQIAEDVEHQLGRLSKEISWHGFPVSARSGVVGIGACVDTTIREAELALFLAKARAPRGEQLGLALG